MPYKRVGKTVYSKSSGKWKKKQTATSVPRAKRAMKLLRGLEHGTIKPSEVGNSRRKRRKLRRKTEKKWVYAKNI